jgi:hypothetical protein
MSRPSRPPTRRRARMPIALIAVVLLAAACTEPTDDVRSPAPTGSLTPATSAEATASP